MNYDFIGSGQKCVRSHRCNWVPQHIQSSSILQNRQSNGSEVHRL